MARIYRGRDGKRGWHLGKWDERRQGPPKAQYSIAAVRPSAKPGDYLVTIARDGEAQGEVIIRTTSAQP
jgi:hypothetical protein